MTSSALRRLDLNTKNDLIPRNDLIPQNNLIPELKKIKVFGKFRSWSSHPSSQAPGSGCNQLLVECRPVWKISVLNSIKFWQCYSFMVWCAKIVRHDHAVRDDLRGVAAINCWLNVDLFEKKVSSIPSVFGKVTVSWFGCELIVRRDQMGSGE